MASLSQHFFKVTRTNPALTKLKRDEQNGKGGKRLSLPVVAQTSYQTPPCTKRPLGALNEVMRDADTSPVPLKKRRASVGANASTNLLPSPVSPRNRLREMIAKRKQRNTASGTTSAPITNFFPVLPKADSSTRFDINAAAVTDGANTEENYSDAVSDQEDNENKENQVSLSNITTVSATPKPATPITSRRIKESSSVVVLVPKAAERHQSASTLIAAESARPDTAGFEKFRALLADKRSQFPLPGHFELLGKMFSGLEAIMCFQISRGQIHALTFHHLQKAVENYCDEGFATRNLAQMITVYPKSYAVTSVSTLLAGRRINTYKLAWGEHDISGLTTVELTDLSKKRIATFTANLQSIVLQHHNIFLESIGLSSLSLDKLNKWHPDFKVENVPEICPADLEPLGEHKTAVVMGSHAPTRSGKVVLPMTDEVKKMSVLERVRLKQRMKTDQTKANQPPELLQKLALLSRLPDLVDRLDLLFASLKKTALYRGDLIKKVVTSSNVPVSSDEISGRLDELIRVVPEWCNEHASQFGTLIKIDRSVKMSSVYSALEAAKRALSGA